MNLRKIGIIISREFSVRVKKKSFIVTTILTPLLFALLMFVPSLIMIYSADADDEHRKVIVVDHSNMMSDAFEDTEHIDYDMNSNGYDLEYMKNNLDSLGIFAIVEVTSTDTLGGVAAVSYSEKQLNRDMMSDIEDRISGTVRKYKLERMQIDNLDEILNQAEYSVDLKTMTIDKKTGEVKESSVMISMVLAYVSAFLIYIFIFTFGNMVMRGVIEEKSTRIVEVIVSSVKPMELMIGKILGVASVALTQFVIWIVLGALIIFGTTSMLGVDEIMEHASQSAEMVGSMPGGDQISGTAVLGDISSRDGMTDLQKNIMDDEDAMGVISSLSDLNITFIIGSLIIYFILGYLLYSSMFAAVGSAVDNEADTQQFLMPITIPLILGLFIMLHTFEYPDSTLSVWASIIPFTSPMVMMARVPFDVPMWQYLLSIGLLVVTFLGVSYLSAKIYRVGILMYGQKISWKDLGKWLKFK